MSACHFASFQHPNCLHSQGLIRSPASANPATLHLSSSSVAFLSDKGCNLQVAQAIRCEDSVLLQGQMGAQGAAILYTQQTDSLPDTGQATLYPSCPIVLHVPRICDSFNPLLDTCSLFQQRIWRQSPWLWTLEVSSR